VFTSLFTIAVDSLCCGFLLMVFGLLFLFCRRMQSALLLPLLLCISYTGDLRLHVRVLTRLPLLYFLFCREDAERAIRTLDGYGYDNLILHVEWAAPRAERG
jgi:hypothetical protein